MILFDPDREPCCCVPQPSGLYFSFFSSFVEVGLDLDSLEIHDGLGDLDDLEAHEVLEDLEVPEDFGMMMI